MTYKSVNLHRRNKKNVGDMASTPVSYFDLGDVETIDIDRVDPVDAREKLTGARLLVIGGGGLFLPYWVGPMKRVVDIARSVGGVLDVVWGIGTNNHDTTSAKYRPWVEEIGLVGIRDYGNPFEWVPCSSCMANIFDQDLQPEHEYVIYDHGEKHVPVKDTGIPRSSNFSHDDIESAVRFISKGEIVLTSSYHGMYWATLLGRKCVVWPFSSRFYHMKHKPTFADREQWWECAAKARSYPEALVECRSANVRFYDLVWECFD